MTGLSRARLRTLLPLLAAFFFVLAPVARAENIADIPQPTDYVSDLAHVLSPEAVQRLDSICEQLDHSQANAKIAVVTVNNLDGDDAADFATKLEDHWKMGDKGVQGQNRYAMVLLAVADHKYRIEVGYGLEGILPDGKTGDIGRAMVPDLKAGDYDGAVTLAVGQVAQVIADDAKITLTQDQPVSDTQPEQQHSAGWGRLILFLIIILFFGGSSLFRILFGASLFFGGWGRGGWGGGSGMGGGFGGGGGGGGGFGGFGGGGGGFGGGGAGGSW